MKKEINYLSVIVILLVFTSCVSTYIPNSINTPLFQGENELNIATNYCYNNDWNIQTSFSPTRHIGILANGNYSKGLYHGDDNSFHTHIMGEIGAGYYSQIKTHTNVPRMYELYAGYGRGNAKTILENYKSDASGKFDRVFFQFNFGWTPRKYIDLSSALRISYVFFTDYKSNQKYNTKNLKGFFFEPAATLKLGIEEVRVVFQIGASVPTNEKRIDFDYDFLILSTGLEIRLFRHKQKEHKTN